MIALPERWELFSDNDKSLGHYTVIDYYRSPQDAAMIAWLHEYRLPLRGIYVGDYKYILCNRNVVTAESFTEFEKVLVDAVRNFDKKHALDIQGDVHGPRFLMGLSDYTFSYDELSELWKSVIGDQLLEWYLDGRPVITHKQLKGLVSGLMDLLMEEQEL